MWDDVGAQRTRHSGPHFDLDEFPRIGYLATRALRQAGYGSLRQLAGAPRHRLASLENVGPKSLAAIETALHQYGLSLDHTTA